MRTQSILSKTPRFFTAIMWHPWPLPVATTQYLAQTPILPTMSPTKVKSICLLGCGHLKQGIPCRPRMLKQKETLDVLTNFPKPDETGQPQSFWNHPMIPGADPVISPSIATPADNTLAARNRRYHQRRREIKRGRTE